MERDIVYAQLSRHNKEAGGNREVTGTEAELHQFGVEECPPAPIQILPMELLSYIFRYHVDSGSSPWILTKVSETWMHTALSTPQLWSYLCVPTYIFFHSTSGVQEYVVAGKKQFSLENWQLCFDRQEAYAALRRSGAVPLNIRIGGGEMLRSALAPSFILEAMDEPLCKRLRCFDVSAFRHINPLFATGVPIGPFPRLRELKLPESGGSWRLRLLKKVSVTSPHLDVARIPVDGNEFLDVASHKFWSQLKHLAMGGRAEWINLVTTKLCDIESFTHSSYNWPNAETPVCTWSHTRDLRLHCNIDSLNRLHLPRLQTLELTVSWDGLQAVDTIQEYKPLFYPMLKSLELVTDHPQWPLYSTNAFPGLVNLTLTTSADDGMIISILKSAPKVQIVKISGSRRPEYGMTFLQHLQNHNALLCPELTRLSLGECGLTVRTPQSKARPLLEMLVKYRRQIGRPLEELKVRWADRREFVHYTSSAARGIPKGVA